LPQWRGTPEDEARPGTQVAVLDEVARRFTAWVAPGSNTSAVAALNLEHD